MKTASSNHDHFQGFSPLNYTQAPDQFFDEIAPFLKEAELKAMLYIIRRTFGFKKQFDDISLSQMLNGIVKVDGERLDYGVGVKKKALLKALTSLEGKGYIIRSRNKSTKRGNESTTYSLNIANSTPLDVQKTPRVGIQKKPRARYPKDTTQETVKQKTVRQETDINSNSKSSKFENSEVEKPEIEQSESRGGGFRSFQEVMEERKKDLGKVSKTYSNRLPNGTEVLVVPQDDKISTQKKSPPKTRSQSLTEKTNLEAVMVKISGDIGDKKHVWENKKQAKNIYSALKERGVSEEQFIDTLFNVRGLTLEVINSLDRPGAYFFQVLRDRWKLKATSH